MVVLDYAIFILRKHREKLTSTRENAENFIFIRVWQACYGDLLLMVTTLYSVAILILGRHFCEENMVTQNEVQLYKSMSSN